MEDYRDVGARWATFGAHGPHQESRVSGGTAASRGPRLGSAVGRGQAAPTSPHTSPDTSPHAAARVLRAARARIPGLTGLALPLGLAACAGALGGCPSPASRAVTPGATLAPSCPVVPRPVVCNLHASRVRPGPPRLAIDPALPREGYVIDVDDRGLSIRAGSDEGAFRAKATLAILRDEAGALPRGHVEDHPRFAWRGLHVDVARHFLPRADVLALIERMALAKLDVLHLHLSDDQGFRLPVAGHPELTAVGGKDGAYAEEDIRAIVEHARARFVTVVPEIDVPGHVRAVLASHPEVSCTGGPFEVPRTWGIFDDVLCVGNEATFALLGDVLDALVRLFPGPFVHVGGDEVPEARWSACPKCRARMKAEGLGTARELQGWFGKRIAAMVRARGRTPVGWDEMLEAGLPPGTVVMAWRSAEVGLAAARAGHSVVMVPNESTYLNDPTIPWTRVLAFDPAPPSLEPAARARILGGQVALWSEEVTSLAEADQRLFPRALAAAESMWSPSPGSPADFPARLVPTLAALERVGAGYFVEPPTGMPKKRVFLDRAEVRLAPPALHPGARVVTTAGAEVTGPLSFTASAELGAYTILPNGKRSAVVTGRVVKESPRPPRELDLGPIGVFYTYIEGTFDKVPAFDGAPLASGLLPRIERPERHRAENWAARFEGRFVAPRSGVWTFTARADDGILVDVDGERVIEDDGVHEPRESAGEIALAAGAHRLVVSYFQGEGEDALDLFVEGPGQPRVRLEGAMLRAPATTPQRQSR